MSTREKRDTITMLFAGYDEMIKKTNAQYMRGLLTGEEQENRNREILETIKEALLSIV